MENGEIGKRLEDKDLTTLAENFQKPLIQKMTADPNFISTYRASSLCWGYE